MEHDGIEVHGGNGEDGGSAATNLVTQRRDKNPERKLVFLVCKQIPLVGANQSIRLASFWPHSNTTHNLEGELQASHWMSHRRSVYSRKLSDKRMMEWLPQRLGLKDTAVRKMVQRFPTLLGYSVHDNIEPKLKWLQKRLGLNDAEVGKIIQLNPSLLSNSMGNSLEPKLEWLQQRLGLDGPAVTKVVQQFPALLRYSVEDSIEPTLK